MKNVVNVLKKNTQVKDFLINKIETEKVDFGINGKIIGGPYSPIENAINLSGSIKILWKNDEISTVNITSNDFEDPKYLLNRAKLVSYKDEYGKEFVEPYNIRFPVKQFSREVDKIIYKRKDYLVDQLKQTIQIESRVGIKSHEAILSSSKVKIKVYNSKGLTLEQKLTNYSEGIVWNNRFYFILDSRQPLKINEFKNNLKFQGQLYDSTNNIIKIGKFKTKNLKVIISPEETYELFAFFIYANLDGTKIANNMSHFHKKDFIKRVKKFGSWFSLKTDPLKRLTPGGTNFSGEGVRANTVTFIDKGKLITPVLDLKNAKKLSMKPTTASLNTPNIIEYFHKSDKDVKNTSVYISNCEEGIYVPSILGLHTQNFITGDYSLSSPYSLYIKDGNVVGSVKTIIFGNFFDDLNKDVEFVSNGIFPLPGISYSTGITLE